MGCLNLEVRLQHRLCRVKHVSLCRDNFQSRQCGRTKPHNQSLQLDSTTRRCRKTRFAKSHRFARYALSPAVDRAVSTHGFHHVVGKYSLLLRLLHKSIPPRPECVWLAIGTCGASPPVPCSQTPNSNQRNISGVSICTDSWKSWR